ncbi:MAG TPA: hypothetical protein VGN15_06740 [Ktedonobacteraceae bacterium]|nr:hypothetical protein [Ktedonobacteraceae bacterium]
MQLVVAVLAFAVALHVLNQILHLKGSWENLGKALANSDKGLRQVAWQAVGFWLLNLAFLLLLVLALALVVTGHVRITLE